MSLGHRMLRLSLHLDLSQVRLGVLRLGCREQLRVAKPHHIWAGPQVQHRLDLVELVQGPCRLRVVAWLEELVYLGVEGVLIRWYVLDLELRVVVDWGQGIEVDLGG